MRDYTGLVLVLIGIGFVVAGFRHRSRGRPGAPPSAALAATGALVRPLVQVVLVYTGLKASLVWALLDGGRVFSPFDLAGFLVFLASYGTWLGLRTRPAAVPGRAAGTAGIGAGGDLAASGHGA